MFFRCRVIPARRHDPGVLVPEVALLGHGAGDADAADIGAAADAGHPAALGHVAVDDRPPAADLDQALRRAVLVGEIGLLVVAGAIAAFMHGLAEQPGRPQLVVQRDHRRQPRRLVEQVQQRFGHVVRLDGAAGNIDDGYSGLGAEIPTEVVGQSHAARRVARHGVNAAIGRAGTGRHHRPGFRGQPVDPGVERDRLAGLRVGAQRRPVALALDVLIGDRAFDDQDEGRVETPSAAAYQSFKYSSPPRE